MKKGKPPTGRTGKIIYWIVTLWLSLGMVSTGIVQLISLDEEVEKWPYAGFALLMSGAILLYLTVNDRVMEYFGPTLLLLLTGISSYLRPDHRKITSQQKKSLYEPNSNS